MEPVAIRGHHLLCALGFRGTGYSPAFVENMAAILRRLDATPAAPVLLVDAPDAICAACPSSHADHCTEASPLQRDRAVLSSIGRASGDTAPWDEIRTEVVRAFDPGDLNLLCANCPWLPYGYCQEGLDRRKKQRDVIS